MERLTERKYGEIVSSKREKEPIQCSTFCNNCSQGTGNCNYVKEMVEKLAKYEDLEEQCIAENQCGIGELLMKWKAFFGDIAELYEYRKAEEQGLLLRLPCPVGTKVYALVNECEEMYEPSSWYTTISEEKFDFYMIDVFGKEVFLTREEAEAAIAEKGGAE